MIIKIQVTAVPSKAGASQIQENWEKYDQQEFIPDKHDVDEDPHCEDENFNMDADYDPKQAKLNLMEELKRTMGKKRRNRKRKSKLAQLLSDEKPKFVPDMEKKYSEFMEEYYKMDCEDVIGGDLPTRFKYREVVPNDFGLTIEEILLADDKELTQWVPLKKIVKYRPENAERGEIKTYAQKAADERLKKKILPSLFKDLPEEPEIVVPTEEINKKRKKKKRKKNKKPDSPEGAADSNILADDLANESIEEKDENNENKQVSKKKSKSKHDISQEHNDNETIECSKSDTALSDNNIEKPKKKKKRKHDSSSENNSTELNDDISENIKESENKQVTDDSVNYEASHDLNKGTNKYKKSKENKTHKESTTSEVNKIKSKDKLRKESVNSEIINTSDFDNENFNKKAKTSFTVDTVINAGPTRITEEKVNGRKEQKKKSKHENSFVVETLEPNVQSGIVNSQQVKINEAKHADNKKNNLKRKLEPLLSTNFPINKRMKNKRDNSQVNTSKINSKNKFKRKNNMTSTNEKTSNPLGNLSDERLKAYGLNPKKYRSFLKYKKF